MQRPSNPQSPLPPGNQAMLLDEVIAALRISESTAYRLRSQGVLRTIKLGHKLIRWVRADVEKLLAGQQRAA